MQKTLKIGTVQKVRTSAVGSQATFSVLKTVKLWKPPHVGDKMAQPIKTSEHLY